MISRRTLLAAPVLLAAQPAMASEVFAALLARHVVEGEDGINRVRYAAWAARAEDRAALARWTEGEAARTPSRMPRDEAFAFWANLYNALTLKEVVDHFPVGSIKEIKSHGVPFDPKGWFGPWRTRLVTVEGRRLSLDDIEHVIMRPTFKDPRVHYAVNCAALGCPNLRPVPWNATTLDRDLDAAAAAFVNHPRGVTVRPDGGLRVSSIYTWFGEDFGGAEGTVAHVRRYAAPPLAARLGPAARIAEDMYDWSLNVLV